jgi:hypothetical protein
MKIQHGDAIRDMTPDEEANYRQCVENAAAAAAAADARAAALASARTKLAALGLTDAEVAALLGG